MSVDGVRKQARERPCLVSIPKSPTMRTEALDAHIYIYIYMGIRKRKLLVVPGRHGSQRMGRELDVDVAKDRKGEFRKDGIECRLPF